MPRLLLCCVLLCTLAFASCAGAKARKTAFRQAACTEMAEMKAKGVLVVRLRTYSARLNKLRQEHARTDLKPKTVEQLGREIASLENFRDSTHRIIKDAFKTFYDFSAVLFMLDTSSARLFQKQAAGYFLDENLRPDALLSVGDRNVYIFDYELTTINQSDLVAISTLDGKPFEAPFAYIGRGGVQREFQQSARNYTQIVSRFNQLFFEMELRCKMNRFIP